LRHYLTQSYALAGVINPVGLFNLTPEDLIIRLIVILIAMTVHEFAHCYVADLMGDPTPRSMGRLTLNPFVHINWIGFLMFVLVGFGILGQAPISPWRMRNPRWGGLAAVAAGPLSNLLLAIIFAIPLRLLIPAYTTGANVPEFVINLLYTSVSFNILLCLFNLIPLFPIDGWRIVLALLPPDLADWWQRNQQISYYVFIGLILLSFVHVRGIPDIFGTLIGGPTDSLTRLLLGLR
jgi:Zn-dependent protease